MFSSFFFTDFYWVVDCFWKASLLCGPSGAWTGLGSYRRVLWYNRGGGSSTSPFVRGLDCLFLPPHSASSSQIEWHFGRIPQSMALGFWGIFFIFCLSYADWCSVRTSCWICTVAASWCEVVTLPTGQSIQMSTSPLAKLETCSVWVHMAAGLTGWMISIHLFAPGAPWTKLSQKSDYCREHPVEKGVNMWSQAEH